MLKRIALWCGIIVGTIVILPSIIVFGGGFYSPVLLESIQNQTVGKIQSAKVDDYREQEVIEVLARVIPPSSHIEALKAQAVIVRTYMLRRELGIVEEGNLNKMSIDEMKELWKEDFDEIYDAYQAAAYGTQGEVIFYEEELIEPVYHKESAGATRDAKGLYNIEVPYLKSVASTYDTVSSEKVIAKQEVIDALQKAYPQIIIDPMYIEKQIQIVSRDAGGYIESLQIGNILLTGEVFRKIFDLPSAAVSITTNGESFVFKTQGIGHGVGLSQNGANKMALEGKSYKEIIEYYYTGVKIHK